MLSAGQTIYCRMIRTNKGGKDMNKIMAHLMHYPVIICVVGLRQTMNKLKDSRSSDLYFSTNREVVMVHANGLSVTGLHKLSQIADCRAIIKSSTVPVNFHHSTCRQLNLHLRWRTGWRRRHCTSWTSKCCNSPTKSTRKFLKMHVKSLWYCLAFHTHTRQTRLYQNWARIVLTQRPFWPFRWPRRTCWRKVCPSPLYGFCF